LLLSETRLHGKQDKPEGSKHGKTKEKLKTDNPKKSLTNPGHTGFL
jgi:hypothetical protein